MEHLTFHYQKHIESMDYSKKKFPHSMLHTHSLPYHREAEMRERLVVVIVVVVAAILRAAMP